MDPTGHETVLHSIGNADVMPRAGVILGPAGELYGTSLRGGTFQAGAVYRLDANGHETLLHSFGGTDGEFPRSGLILDAAGNLYGNTEYGGVGCSIGCGVAFKLDPSGNETVLHRFEGPGGTYPFGSMFRGGDGNLYGTTFAGGRRVMASCTSWIRAGKRRFCSASRAEPAEDIPRTE